MSRFYAVAVGRQPGIYMDWPTAHQQVDRFPSARYRAFANRAAAEAYLSNSPHSPESRPLRNPATATPPEKATPHETAAPPAPVELPEALIYTDGSCVNSQGGYAVINVTHQQIQYGPVPLHPCTNQKAELYAILRALPTQPQHLRIRTDSQYAIKSLTLWIITWRHNGWRTSNGKPVENRALIEAIAEQMSRHGSVVFEHVRGHQGEQYNELADTYANYGRQAHADQTTSLTS
jgi:ribonuclease HI